MSTVQQKMLLQILKNIESLLGGTLGDWITKLVSFQLMKGATPHHGQTFLVTKIHKEVLIKGIESMHKLGVLEQQHPSEWGLQSFIVPKKNNTLCFLSNFCEVNKRLVRKLFPIPKISMVLQLEGFSFATTLDLNMGYYTIILDPDASKICTITFPWRKYSFKRLSMGIASFPDMFQSKMSELMEFLEYVWAYFNDLLCISKVSLEDHLEKLH